MPNIFELGKHLQSIFEVIEENDGELTPELEEELDITSQNFKDKIEAYCQVLTIYNSDVECCKNETSRVNSIQNVKKNTIERIKQNYLGRQKKEMPTIGSWYKRILEKSKENQNC